MANTTNRWVMTVPVLSTAHLPGPQAPAKAGLLEATAHDGPLQFVHVGWDYETDDGRTSWIDPLAAWLRENYDTEWVRFDPDGDIIDGLPTYDW